MCEPAIYRTSKNRSDLSGRDICEFFPARPDHRISRTNTGALYIRREGLLPFLEVVRPFSGRVSPIAIQVSGRHLLGLQLGLDLIWRGLIIARSAEDLKRISPRVCVTPSTFPLVRPELMRTSASLAEAVYTARNGLGCLWLVGLDSGARPGSH